MKPRSPTVNRVMADERAASFTRRSIKKQSKQRALRLALSMLDLTTLEGKDSPEKVRGLCRKAISPDPLWPGPGAHDSSTAPLPSVAAVCVYPSMVKIARRELGDSPVLVASVATGFPSGQYPLRVRLDDTRRALDDGADEIDMVINRGALLAGDEKRVADEVAAVKEVCAASAGSRRHPIGGGALVRAGGAPLKVILETGELETYDLVRRAGDLSIHAGLTEGDFIKTSTGKVQPAATMGVTLVMLESVRDHYLNTGVRIGVKPAGGIRTAKQAVHYLVMLHETLGDDWLTPALFRFGASTLTNDILMQLAKERSGRYAAAFDFSES